MKVKVYADIACPWCRLRTHQFDRAVAAAGGEQDVELVHLPYQLDPDGSEEPRPLIEAMAEMFGRERAGTMVTEMTRLGASEGVEYRFDRAVAVDTFTAHRLLWFALRDYDARLQAALATALYEAHFRDGENIADHAELTGLAERVGLAGVRVKSFLASDEGVAEVREQVAAARQDGITSVPTFVSEDGELLRGASGTEAILDALARAVDAPEPVPATEGKS